MLHALFQRNKFILLLLLLLTYFISTSIVTDTRFEYLLTYASVILMVVSLYVISGERRFLLVSAVFLLLSVVLVMLTDWWFAQHQVWFILQALLSIAFFTLMLLTTLYYTIRGPVSTNNLCGAVCTYLLLGLTWSYIYLLIAFLEPSAFSSLEGVAEVRDKQAEFIYFSFVTLTTLGYGDIYPVTDFAKTISWLEAAFGQLYIAVLVAQLVGLYTSYRRNMANDI